MLCPGRGCAISPTHLPVEASGSRPLAGVTTPGRLQSCDALAGPCRACRSLLPGGTEPKPGSRNSVRARRRHRRPPTRSAAPWSRSSSPSCSSAARRPCSPCFRATGALTPRRSPSRPVRATRGSRGPRRWSPRPGSRPVASRQCLLHPATLVLVERTIISSPVVWIGGGSERHMAMLSPTELVRLTRGSLVDLAQE